MIKSPDYEKRFNSAKVRFLKGALDNFFQREFPKLIGPILRDKLIDELIKILEKTLPLKDHLKPGQIVWNALDIRTRADSKNPKFVPVILTLINEQDIEKLANGVPMSKVRDHAIARIQKEAYQQGGLLSMRDIGYCSPGVMAALFLNIESTMKKNIIQCYLIPDHYKMSAVVFLIRR